MSPASCLLSWWRAIDDFLFEIKQTQNEKKQIRKDGTRRVRLEKVLPTKNQHELIIMKWKESTSHPNGQCWMIAPGDQGRIQRLRRSPTPPKTYKVILFTIRLFCLYNSVNSIRNIRPFCHPSFCHISAVEYT